MNNFMDYIVADDDYLGSNDGIEKFVCYGKRVGKE